MMHKLKQIGSVGSPRAIARLWSSFRAKRSNCGWAGYTHWSVSRERVRTTTGQLWKLLRPLFESEHVGKSQTRAHQKQWLASMKQRSLGGHQRRISPPCLL